jgi:hypothetical protein
VYFGRERQTFCGDLLHIAYPADADGSSSEMVTWHNFIEYCNFIVTVPVRNPYVLELHIISKLQ